jgi:hypothetical protein
MVIGIGVSLSVPDNDHQAEPPGLIELRVLQVSD